MDWFTSQQKLQRSKIKPGAIGLSDHYGSFTIEKVISIDESKDLIELIIKLHDYSDEVMEIEHTISLISMMLV